MSSTDHLESQGFIGRWVNSFEENAIALILGLMTLVTFVNVILRYGLNTGLIWGLEATLFLFAWLVLFGMSYCVKVTAHIGVDALITYFSPSLRRAVALLAAGICLAYGFLLLKGSWDFYANFAGFPGTTGSWYPTGFDSDFMNQSWYEGDDIPIPEFMRFLEPMFNDGEAYEKLPLLVPYLMLPVGVALLFFRLIQATYRIYTGKIIGLIASHEVEDALEEIEASRVEGAK